ncbi:tellurium resistance protein TerC [bacterium]|nr:tellurium resistance protein TerC [bacterium]
MVGNLITLGLLILLQAVLGFDNLLYISLESKHAPKDKQQSVRAWGIGVAIFLRIGLLGLLVSLKKWFEEFNVCEFDFPGYTSGHFNIHSLIVLAGGAFIIYTAMKEIWHMTRLEHDDHGGGESNKKSLGMVIFWIVVMNIVFSFDSILSAMALTEVFWVMAAAIILSGLMMIWLADRVANFLEKNRMYEVLGLFVLFVVGIMLVSEGGHLAHLSFFGNNVEAMSKTTFYFVLVVLVLTDIVQGQYQKKLLAETQREAKHS